MGSLTVTRPCPCCQAVNHGVEHRTNITTILFQQGIQPPDLDGWEYVRLNPDRMEA
jgi:hypothetical protein